MSARTDVVDLLTAETSYRVIPYARDVDGVTDITLMVQRTGITFQGSLPVSEVNVYLLTGKQDPAQAEDALDDALDIVLTVLAGSSLVSESSAERIAWYDKFPGYQISLQVPNR